MSLHLLARLRRFIHCFVTLDRMVTGYDERGRVMVIGCDCGRVFWKG